MLYGQTSPLWSCCPKDIASEVLWFVQMFVCFLQLVLDGLTLESEFAGKTVELY